MQVMSPQVKTHQVSSSLGCDHLGMAADGKLRSLGHLTSTPFGSGGLGPVTTSKGPLLGYESLDTRRPSTGIHTFTSTLTDSSTGPWVNRSPRRAYSIAIQSKIGTSFSLEA